VRKEVADFEAAVAVRLKCEGAFHQIADGPVVRAKLEVALVGLPVVFGESRLRVERIDLARRAVHEEEDAVLRLRREVRGEGRGVRGEGFGGGEWGGEETVAAKEIDEGE
jgi:hypothetical protein